MNKYKLLIISLAFIVLPHITYADCTDEERDYFKRIEEDYKVTYEYNKGNDTYTINFYSPEPDKYDFAAYIGESAECEEINDNTSICRNIPSDDYVIKIFGRSDTCHEELKTMLLTLTKHNDYSNDPLCEGIEEFVLCQPSYDKVIDYDTFVSRVNIYKKTKQREKEIEKKNTSKSNEIISNILNSIKENLVKVIAVIIFIIVIIKLIIELN